MKYKYVFEQYEIHLSFFQSKYPDRGIHSLTKLLDSVVGRLQTSDVQAR